MPGKLKNTETFQIYEGWRDEQFDDPDNCGIIKDTKEDLYEYENQLVEILTLQVRKQQQEIRILKKMYEQYDKEHRRMQDLIDEYEKKSLGNFLTVDGKYVGIQFKENGERVIIYKLNEKI